MAENIWPTVHAERQALADDLGELTDDQWQTKSLCRDWTVHDVLAHQLATAKMTPPKFLGKFTASGFNFTKFNAKEVAREGAGGPAATLAAFRTAQNRTSSPPGPQDSWLGEVLVHSEDIRRPLNIGHDYPLPAVTRTLQFFSRSNAIIGSKNRIAGLTLKATDTDFSLGSGPVVEGPAMSLLMAATGRSAALDDLTGPGVDELRSRR